MAKANKTPAAAPAATVPTTNNPVLKALNKHLQDQSKLAELGTKLLAIEAEKAKVEGEIQVLLGTPAGTQVSTTTPRGKQVAAKSGKGGGKAKAPAAAAAASTGKARTGPKTENDESLGDVLYTIVKDLEPTSVADLAKKALDKGYKTTSKNFAKVVRQVVSNDTRFRAKKDGNNVLYSAV